MGFTQKDLEHIRMEVKDMRKRTTREVGDIALHYCYQWTVQFDLHVGAKSHLVFASYTNLPLRFPLSRWPIISQLLGPGGWEWEG